MRVFISHAWQDKPLALALAQLPDFVDVWVDVRELLGGQSLDPTIVRAIEDSHVFIVLVSRTSLGKAWVAKEVEWALAREAQKAFFQARLRHSIRDGAYERRTNHGIAQGARL